jgi:hypothetical protein
LTTSQVFGLVTEIYITLFLHLLVIKDGWKVLDSLQVLLKHSEERGFFSANAVARAFNWALLSALASDTQIIARSLRDPLLLENCIYTLTLSLTVSHSHSHSHSPLSRSLSTLSSLFTLPLLLPYFPISQIKLTQETDVYWAAFLEQNLFPSQQQTTQKPTTPKAPHTPTSSSIPTPLPTPLPSLSPSPSDDPFLPPIFRGESGAWTDFHFAQKLLEFFDQIAATSTLPALVARTSQTQLLNSLPTAIAPASSLSHLVRMLLRVTLVMLYETDSVLHTERITKKKQSLKQVEQSVAANFGNMAGMRLER